MVEVKPKISLEIIEDYQPPSKAKDTTNLPNIGSLQKEHIEDTTEIAPLYNNPLEPWEFELVTDFDISDAKSDFLEELIALSESSTDVYKLQETMKQRYETLYPSGFWQQVYATRSTLSKCKKYCLNAHSAIYWTTSAYSVYANKEVILFLGKFAFQFLI